MKNIIDGAMRGLGRLKPTSVIVFIAYYLIAPPFYYLFACHFHYEVSGLWAGQTVGVIFHLGAILYLINIRLDWNEIVEETRARSKRDKKLENISRQEVSETSSTETSKLQLKSRDLSL